MNSIILGGTLAYFFEVKSGIRLDQWALYISGVRSSGHRVKPNMAAMEALSYVGFSPPTRSFMFTCYVKTAQGDWNRRNSGPGYYVIKRRNQLDSTSTLNRLVCISTSRKIRLCALMHQLHLQLLWRGVSRLWGRFHLPWEYFPTIKFLVHESNNHSIPVNLSVMSDDVYPNMGITKQVRLATR